MVLLVILLCVLFYFSGQFILVILVLLFYLYGNFFILSAYQSGSFVNQPVELLKGKISKLDIKKEHVSFILTNESKEKVQVSAFGKKERDFLNEYLNENMYCEMEVGLAELTEASNPGQFNYPKYLYESEITSNYHLSDLNSLQCEKNGLSYFSFRTIRKQLINIVLAQHTNNTGAWIIALLLGETSYLPESTLEIFRKWNIAHLLAISGFHTGIVLFVSYFFLTRILKLTRERAQWTVSIILFIFLFLAGAAPSVVRASLMAILFIFSQKLQIKTVSTDIISLVFIVLLLFNPNLIYHIGFQFSFAVTFSLLLSHPLFRQSESRIYQSFQISFISAFSILPLQLHYFSTFHPLSIFVNLLVVPYFSLVIPLMLIFLILTFLPQTVLHLLTSPFELLHSFVIQQLEHLNYLFKEMFIVGDLSLYLILLYYFVFYTLLYFLEKKEKASAWISGVGLILIVLYFNHQEHFREQGNVTMLDVDQADALVIELVKQKGVFLIDVGALFSFETFEATPKVYKQIIKPYLYHRGIYQIDAIFLTHDDLDHTGSLKFLVEDFKVNEIIISQFHPVNQELIQLVNQHNISLTQISEAVSLKRKGQTFHILSPIEDKRDANENSLVIYSRFGSQNFLFTGDASKQIEKEILERHPSISVDVLKVGHHGSNTSTDPFFIKENDIKFAFISAGRKSRYGHPTKEVLATLMDEEIHVFQTPKHGAVRYVYPQNEYFELYLNENKKAVR